MPSIQWEGTLAPPERFLRLWVAPISESREVSAWQ